MSKLKELLLEQSKLLTQLDLLGKAIHAEQSKTLAECVDNVYGKGCGKSTQIGNLVYVQTHWYTGPHGCTGGDYWSEGEGRFVCPKCNHTNRLYNRRELQELKARFQSVVDKHEE